MKKVTIYTDGACSGNPGIGGWGAILMYGEARKEISGAERETTNNRMELFAAISALKCLKEACEVDLYTDSTYLCDTFVKKWIWNWVRNGWQTSAKKPVENKVLWVELLDLYRFHRISFHKVKGHADNPYNNRCDKLATDEVAKLKKQLGNELIQT